MVERLLTSVSISELEMRRCVWEKHLTDISHWGQIVYGCGRPA